MTHKLTCIVRFALLGAPFAGCVGPNPRPISEPITVRVTSADIGHSVRFTLDIMGEARLRAPQMRGWATNDRLEASTPAVVILSRGTTAASFHALGDGRVEISAVAPQARLWADGARVRIASTVAGLSIRDY